MLMKLAPKKPRSLRNFYLSIGATLVLMLAGRFYALKAEEQLVAQRAQWVENVLHLNSTLPRQVDALTRLERIDIISGDTIAYRYQVDMASSSLPWERKSKMEARVRAGLERLACKEPEFLEAMRRFKFRQEHFYTGYDNAFLFSVDINPDKLICPT